MILEKGDYLVIIVHISGAHAVKQELKTFLVIADYYSAVGLWNIIITRLLAVSISLQKLKHHCSKRPV